jgi:hypothetical protein
MKRRRDHFSANARYHHTRRNHGTGRRKRTGLSEAAELQGVIADWNCTGDNLKVVVSGDIPGNTIKLSNITML